ncbi:MAG: anhydro-N-acetylmuramic acid kinase [Burkholderiales bacterium]|nr:anhydro-N-acetylmuramic acid kinase [Burkholderiales bacterium]
MPLYAGLMSGTSLDGVDAVLAHWPSADEATPAGSGRTQRTDRGAGPAGPARPVELAFVHRPMPAALREAFMRLNAEGPGEVHRAALAANALARLYAEAVAELLERAGVRAHEVRAIGAHGQTVRHRPGEFDGTGYTTQLLNGALLAEHTGIDVVCDFRSRDVAAGGQGAPLVPAFHAEVFGGNVAGGVGGEVGGEEGGVAVLNVGGIANLTLLPAAGPVRGFDCGPGNVLMDLWCERCTGQRFDGEGRFAASGRVHEGLLRGCLEEPYFSRPPPKSTGRDLFDAGWLDARLAAVASATAATAATATGAGALAGRLPTIAPADVMATLAELTAATASDALARHGAGTRRLLVCGGGAYNAHLMRRLVARAGAAVEVASTAAQGVAPDHVEALAFAWLARAFGEGQAGNLPAVTGAAGPRRLGALYPA